MDAIYFMQITPQKSCIFKKSTSLKQTNQDLLRLAFRILHNLSLHFFHPYFSYAPD